VWAKQVEELTTTDMGRAIVGAFNRYQQEPLMRLAGMGRDLGINPQLAKWTDKVEEVFEWVNNSWFEVCHEDEGDYYSEPFHTLDEAIEYAEAEALKVGN
jgi:hypothetical protein